MDVTEEERPFLCEECNKRFKYKHNLMQHKIIHSSENEQRPFLCEECNKRFKWKHNLTQHKKAHSVSRYNCTECNRVFRAKVYLTRHLKIHTGERPFTSNMCDSTFSDNSRFVKHKKTPSIKGAYVCETCNKRFRYKKTLKIHIKSHTEDRPFVCQVCHKKFKAKRYLKRHYRRHPEEQLIPVRLNEQLNERTCQDTEAEDHENSSPNEGIDVQGIGGPLHEVVGIHRTQYEREGSSCEENETHCLTEPGSEFSLQGTNNRQMEDPGEGPSYCKGKDSQRTDDIESPSSDEIDIFGMKGSSDSSSWEVSPFPRIENYLEGLSYENILGMDIHPPCEGTNINPMEDTPERPLSLQGISNLEMEDPGENVPLEDTGPHEIQDPGEGPSSSGIIRTNIGGEADLHQSWNLPGDMVPKAVDSSDSPTSEEEQTSESPQSCEECARSFKQEEGPLICEECDENLSGES